MGPRDRIRSFVPLTLAALAFGVGCASTTAGSGSSASASGSSASGRPIEAEGPRWLDDLHVGDVLVYHVDRLDDAGLVAEVEVARLVRRGVGVAALLWPTPGTARDLGFRSRWLAADDHAIHQLVAVGETLDPQFTPLDAEGHVVTVGLSPETTSDARPLWSLPHALRPDQSTLGGGWELDELDFQLEGPVRGDRCARLRREPEGDQRTSVVVCANVGIAEVVVDRDELTIVERWRLVDVRSASR